MVASIAAGVEAAVKRVAGTVLPGGNVGKPGGKILPDGEAEAPATEDGAKDGTTAESEDRAAPPLLPATLTELTAALVAPPMPPTMVPASTAAGSAAAAPRGEATIIAARLPQPRMPLPSAVAPAPSPAAATPPAALDTASIALAPIAVIAAEVLKVAPGQRPVTISPTPSAHAQPLAVSAPREAQPPGTPTLPPFAGVAGAPSRGTETPVLPAVSTEIASGPSEPAPEAPRPALAAAVQDAAFPSSQVPAPVLQSSPVPAPIDSPGPSRPAEAPQDFATLVGRLSEAREAASPHLVRTALNHAQFGPVSLEFRHEDRGLSVTMTSASPGFNGSVQAALAASLAGSLAGGAQNGSSGDPPRDSGQPAGQHQPATSGNAASGGGADPRQQASGADRGGAGERQGAGGQQGSSRERQAHHHRSSRPEPRDGDRSGIYA